MGMPNITVPERHLQLGIHEAYDDFSFPRVRLGEDEVTPTALALGAVSKLTTLMVHTQMEDTHLSGHRAAVIAADQAEARYGRFNGTDIKDGKTTYGALHIALGKAATHGFRHVVAAAYWGPADEPGRVCYPPQEAAALFTVDNSANMFFLAADQKLNFGQLLLRRELAKYAHTGVAPDVGNFFIATGLSIRQHEDALLTRIFQQLTVTLPRQM